MGSALDGQVVVRLEQSTLVSSFRRSGRLGCRLDALERGSHALPEIRVPVIAPGPFVSQPIHRFRHGAFGVVRLGDPCPGSRRFEHVPPCE